MLLILAPLATAAETVPLHFACPKQAEAAVVFRQTRTEKRGDAPAGPARAIGGFTGTTRWEAEGDRCRVTDRGSFDVSGMPPAVARLMEAMAAEPTSEIVDPSGALVELVGIDAVSSKLRSILATEFGDLPPQQQEGLQRMVDAVSSSEALTAQAADRWRQRAGFWHGFAIEPGFEYTGGGDEAMPDTFRFVGRPIACGARQDCLELEIEWTLSPARIAAAQAELIGPVLAMMPPGATPEAVDASKRVTHRVVVEPETLRPWHHEQVDVVTVTTTFDGAPGTVVRTDVRETTWAWGKPKKRKG